MLKEREGREKWPPLSETSQVPKIPEYGSNLGVLKNAAI